MAESSMMPMRGIFAGLLRPRAPHFDCEQQPGATDQRSELPPRHVGHEPSSRLGVTTIRTLTLPQRGM
jgi:hypothetical protein